MTKRFNKTKGERFQQAETGVSQLQMATRVTQMLLKQMGESITSMSRDFNELTARQRDLQYKVLAIQELSGLTEDHVTKRAESLQIKDFEETSAKEDLAVGATDVAEVADDSVVILTSKLASGGGILRTRLNVSEIGFPQFKQDLLGKKVNDTFDADINGTTHSITVLGIKKLPAKVENVEGQEQPTSIN
jgi:hypothetical protein